MQSFCKIHGSLNDDSLFFTNGCSYCKQCRGEKVHLNYERRRTEILAKLKEKRKENPIHFQEINRRYYLKNKERINLYHKERYRLKKLRESLIAQGAKETP